MDTRDQKQSEDYNHPVAYDVDGKPLYAHPATTVSQTVHVVRPSEPIEQTISQAIKSKHDTSVRLYPKLNLSSGEYVISAVQRHMIGLVVPLILATILLTVSISIVFNYDIVVQILGLTGNVAKLSFAIAPILLFCVLVLFGLYAVYYVYINNRFYLTNESVIQELQISLLSKHEQTVSLNDVEDASYEQKGIAQQIFNYGSIRLSTEGDETTYRFTYVANPKQHIAELNNAVEAFKNGRPVID